MTTTTTTMVLAAGGLRHVVAASCGTGLLDCATTKTNELGNLFRTVASVGGVGFVLWQGFASRGAMARILVSGLAAGIFVWIVFNVTDLRDRVKDEVGLAPAPAVHIVPQSPPHLLESSVWAGSAARRGSPAGTPFGGAGSGWWS